MKVLWRTIVLVVLLGALIPAASGVPAFAQQHRDLEEGYPVQMEDATPIDYGTLQAEGYFQANHYRNRDEGYRIVPGFQIGFAPGWQAALSFPAVWGTVLQSTGGFISASALYNFIPEQAPFPALALEAFVDMPMYLAPQNADLRIKLIATKTLDPAADTRLHLNTAYGYLARPNVNERRARFIGSFGLSREIRPGTSLAVAIAREESRIVGITSDFIEAGIKRTVTVGVTASFSAGAGIGGQSLVYRALAGIQVWICDLICPPGAAK